MSSNSNHEEGCRCWACVADQFGRWIDGLADKTPPHEWQVFVTITYATPTYPWKRARAVDPNDDLVIALPTSAGKTRIAELCILRALADSKRVIYVTPLRDAQRVQILIQDGIVFRLVWAAEAVRVQAGATRHPGSEELGDGPAYALTYGVPSIPAALLCQIGFASRVGAIWVARKLSAAFTDMKGLRNWLRTNDALLSSPEFWESEDWYKLWSQVSPPTNVETPHPWNHATYAVPVEWKFGSPPPPGTQVRIIPGDTRNGTICSTDLTPLGVSQFPFDPHRAALDGSVTADQAVQVAYFGS